MIEVLMNELPKVLPVLIKDLYDNDLTSKKREPLSFQMVSRWEWRENMRKEEMRMFRLQLTFRVHRRSLRIEVVIDGRIEVVHWW